MKAFVVLAVLLIAFAAIFEGRKRRGGRTDNSSDDPSERPLTAAEAGPTETSRLRVKAMLSKPSQKISQAKPEQSSAGEDDPSLPDPFAEADKTNSPKKH